MHRRDDYYDGLASNTEPPWTIGQLPEVLDALSNQVVDLLTLTSAEQVLHLHQLHLQFPDVHVPKSRCP